MSKIPRLLLASVAELNGLSFIWFYVPEDRFSHDTAQIKDIFLAFQSMDIILHCLDMSQLKSRGLQELFPSICR